MKISIEKDEISVGIMVGTFGVGLIKFPWMDISPFIKRPSFWEYFIGSPRIRWTTGRGFKKCSQLRLMWFAIGVGIRDKKEA